MIGKDKKISIIIITLLMIFSIHIQVFAKDANVQLEIDDTTLEMSSSTNITIVLEEMDGANVKSIEGIENFDVLNTSKSASMKRINGEVTRQVQLTFGIMPKAVGDYQLIAHIEYEGKMYQSNALDIQVSEKDDELQKETDEVFIKTTLSKESLYFGEKIVLSYDLYSRYQVADYGFTNKQQFNGFITNPIPEDDLNANLVTINNQQYAKYEIQKTILSPTVSGEITIPSQTVQVVLGSSSFFSKSKIIDIQTDKKIVNVKQLPTQGRPVDFTGLVGDLKIDSHYSTSEIDYGQSALLNVKLSGNVNLDAIENINTLPTDIFSVYQTEKSNDETIFNDSYFAEKEFEIILVPKKTGEIAIEPITLNYFDTETESYKEVSIEKTLIRVNAVSVQQVPQKDTTNTGTNNNVIEPNEIIISQINSPVNKEDYLQIKKIYVYIIAISLFVVILLSVLLSLYFVRKSNVNNNLYSLYKKGKKAKTKEEIYKVLIEMVKYKYNFSLRAYSKKEISVKVNNEGLSEMITNLTTYIEDNTTENSINILREMLQEIYERMSQLD